MMVSDTRPPASFIILGDVMVDTFARSHGDVMLGSDQSATISRQVGGQGANTASWLAWLQESVSLVAACGADADGHWVTRMLQDGGVHPLMKSFDLPTGHCVVIVSPDGQRTMLSDPGANELIARVLHDTWQTTLTSVGSTAHVHLSGYLLERNQQLPAALLQSARETSPGITTSLDTAALVPTAHHAAGLRSAIPYLDVLVGTLDELASLATIDSGIPLHDVSGVIDYWRRQFSYPGVIVLKRGSEGATADDGRKREHLPARPAQVIDTTGAGDAFCAGFLAAWTRDQANLAAALNLGAEAASFAITRIGAGPPPVEGR